VKRNVSRYNNSIIQSGLLYYYQCYPCVLNVPGTNPSCVIYCLDWVSSLILTQGMSVIGKNEIVVFYWPHGEIVVFYWPHATIIQSGLLYYYQCYPFISQNNAFCSPFNILWESKNRFTLAQSSFSMSTWGDCCILLATCYMHYIAIWIIRLYL
jgi:hypothetical protein